MLKLGVRKYLQFYAEFFCLSNSMYILYREAVSLIVLERLFYVLGDDALIS